MPLVVHYWAHLQWVHGLRCYGSITRTRNVSEYMFVLALFLVNFLWLSDLCRLQTYNNAKLRGKDAFVIPRYQRCRPLASAINVRPCISPILKGNSTLKNISPKINIYDKWSYVSVIKLTMQIRYRRILTIKLLISRYVFLHGGGSSKPSSLFLYLCLFVDVDNDMVTKNCCS